MNTCGWLMVLISFLGFWLGGLFGGLLTLLLVCILAVLIYLSDQIAGNIPSQTLTAQETLRQQARLEATVHQQWEKYHAKH